MEFIQTMQLKTLKVNSANNHNLFNYQLFPVF